MIDQKAVEDLTASILDGRIETREKCAIEYAGVIRAAQMSKDEPDVSKLNDAIVIRWSMSALGHIKKRAWSIAGFR